MKNKTFMILILIEISIAGRCLSFAQKTEQCLGLITGLKGEVLVKKHGNNRSVTAAWGTQLFDGDQVMTSQGAEATLAFSNGNYIKLESNGNLTVTNGKSPETKSGEKIKKISSAAFVDLNGLAFSEENRKETGALAGLRSAGDGRDIIPSIPYHTTIKDCRPSFSWDSKYNYENYMVSLYDSHGLLWTRETKSNSLGFPDNAADLVRGESYFWNVEGQENIASDKSENITFTVLSRENIEDLAKKELIIKDSFKNESDSSNIHFVLGSLYYNNGLFQDALKEFQIIAILNSRVPFAHELLGSIYNQMGRKDKAIEELQKALSLVKEQNK